MPNRPRPVMLVILDGWGHNDNPKYNAIAAADTPFWTRLEAEYPHTLVDTSGSVVGLPSGQMGNSEVGHITIGAGRIVLQEFTRIGQAIADGSFARNPVLRAAVEDANANAGVVHILGLLSPGGVHSHEDHIHAMVGLAAAHGAREVLVHAFLDGRDTPPRSAEASLLSLDRRCASLGNARIASLCGRYYSMDRDKRWDRVERAYKLLAAGDAEHAADDAVSGLHAAYARDESDEFVAPTVIGDPSPFADGDAVVFMNFRADRARELTIAFNEDAFDGFERAARPRLSAWVTLTEYHREFRCPVAFPPDAVRNGLGEYVAGRGLRQLRIAETEKYAHVTFFFNGGQEREFPGEDRILVPSPKVATYDLKPEMSAPGVTDRLCEAIGSGRYDFVVCNFANADMVGHSGDFGAAVEAVEAVDSCLARLAAALDEAGGEMLITSDHGNVEQMHDETTGQSHTAHTTNLVPLAYYGNRTVVMNGPGTLSDIAPSLLVLMGLPQPAEMTGRPLLTLAAS